MKNLLWRLSPILMLVFVIIAILVNPLLLLVCLAFYIYRFIQDGKFIKECNEAKTIKEDLGFQRYEDVTTKVEALNQELSELSEKLEQKKSNFEKNIEDEKKNLLSSIDTMNKSIEEKQDTLNSLNEDIDKAEKSIEKANKQLKTQQNNVEKIKELYHSLNYCIDNFFDYEPQENLRLSSLNFQELNELLPSVILKLHSMDTKELRKAFKENDKQINLLLEQYSKRYTTKANIAIYNLMVIALRSELQNILYNLKYEKLDDCISQVKEVTNKYLGIASNGNQSIAGTLTKFIGEIEYLFINAVKIEYNYYIKREQAKQEQQALREQMKQEAEERKALEAEKAKIEKEEQKFNIEIEKLNEQLSSAKDDELDALKARILELQSQLSEVVVKKEEIVNLAQGKAGNVYIISNVGSFGEDVFKIGMTRRLEPQQRIDELGSASVPFKFDVHSFIFSKDAVALENQLHQLLDAKRVNKVNNRKEFFKVSINELEQIVSDIDPTAEFKKTIIAEEYRQSLSEEEILNSTLLANTVA